MAITPRSLAIAVRTGTPRAVVTSGPSPRTLQEKFDHSPCVPCCRIQWWVVVCGVSQGEHLGLVVDLIEDVLEAHRLGAVPSPNGLNRRFEQPLGWRLVSRSRFPRTRWGACASPTAFLQSAPVLPMDRRSFREQSLHAFQLRVGCGLVHEENLRPLTVDILWGASKATTARRPSSDMSSMVPPSKRKAQ